MHVCVENERWSATKTDYQVFAWQVRQLKHCKPRWSPTLRSTMIAHDSIYVVFLHSFTGIYAYWHVFACICTYVHVFMCIYNVFTCSYMYLPFVGRRWFNKKTNTACMTLQFGSPMIFCPPDGKNLLTFFLNVQEYTNIKIGSRWGFEHAFCATFLQAILWNRGQIPPQTTSTCPAQKDNG